MSRPLRKASRIVPKSSRVFLNVLLTARPVLIAWIPIANDPIRLLFLLRPTLITETASLLAASSPVREAKFLATFLPSNLIPLKPLLGSARRPPVRVLPGASGLPLPRLLRAETACAFFSAAFCLEDIALRAPRPADRLDASLAAIRLIAMLLFLFV